MSKQTAVQWLIKKLTPSIALNQERIDEIEQQALDIEYELMLKSYMAALNAGYSDSFEKYYSQTFNQEK